jgi:hypothetical protein
MTFSYRTSVRALFAARLKFHEDRNRPAAMIGVRDGFLSYVL